jgi:hypothetical protein
LTLVMIRTGASVLWGTKIIYLQKTLIYKITHMIVASQFSSFKIGIQYYDEMSVSRNRGVISQVMNCNSLHDNS